MDSKPVKIKHTKLRKTKLDPYELIKSKSQRLSWNSLSDSDVFIDKEAVIDWFSRVRYFEDLTVNSIIVNGLLESEFNNITFILKMIQAPDFERFTSIEAYDFLYHFVDDAPKSIQEWIDEKDYLMSRNVLALLSKNR